ncbi:MAG: SUMF1/EgtB/PvdO family nonheme iron enzyme, partial [Bacteroidota bacterium]
AYESPQHSVELSAYRIGKYPVTNAEYRSFIDETSHPAPHDWDNGNYPEGLSDHPVVHVSWEDAVAYTDWLSKRTGKPYTLPTEAQWERAARGSEGHPFPWGDTFDASLCNSAESGRAGTTPVGTFSPTGDSPYGAADCAGNVSEWCLDWFSEDAYTDRTWMAANDPKGPAEGLFRVQRGGSFNYGRLNVRTAVRHGDYPTERSENVGFRIALRD